MKALASWPLWILFSFLYYASMKGRVMDLGGWFNISIWESSDIRVLTESMGSLICGDWLNNRSYVGENYIRVWEELTFETEAGRTQSSSYGTPHSKTVWPHQRFPAGHSLLAWDLGRMPGGGLSSLQVLGPSSLEYQRWAVQGPWPHLPLLTLSRPMAEYYLRRASQVAQW